ncbi:MAG: hypothetical protein JWL73_273 [Actinomycetia bacterium]|nr:hypothetical protein [Actinomycetes bacterium]
MHRSGPGYVEPMAKQPQRLLVDGINVIGAREDRWWRDREGATRTLAEQLVLMAAGGAEVTLVLDGREVEGLPDGEYEGITIRYAHKRGRDAADDRVAEVVKANPDIPTLVVVTSDRELRARVTALGAKVQGAMTLLRKLDTLTAAAEAAKEAAGEAAGEPVSES